MNKKEKQKHLSIQHRNHKHKDAGLLVRGKVDKIFTDTKWDSNTCEEYFAKQ